MEKKDSLFEYIEKIKNVGEYLARGNELMTPQNNVINFDRNVALQEGKISIEEVSLYDTLESNYYNELGSILKIIDMINECDNQRLEKGISPFISEPLDLKNTPKKFKKEYKAIRSRLKEILNKIVIQLYMGLRIEPTDVDIAIIKSMNFEKNRLNQIEEDAAESDGMEYFEYPEYLDEEEYEEDSMKNTKKTAEDPYLIYSASQKKFYIMKDGEILIEDIDIGIAMGVVTEYLYRTDKERKMKELESGKTPKSKFKYEGMHIVIDDERGE